MSDLRKHPTPYEEYVSDTGEYILPVEWTDYSTVKVKAKNLQEAIDKFNAVISDIPLDTQPEYVDGSYRLNDDNDLRDCQDFPHISSIEIDEDGSIHS